MMISLICPEPGQTEAISVAGRPVYAAPECMEYAKEIFQDAGTLMEDPLLREVHDAGLLWRLGLRQAEESAKDVRARAGNAAEAVLKTQADCVIVAPPGILRFLLRALEKRRCVIRRAQSGAIRPRRAHPRDGALRPLRRLSAQLPAQKPRLRCRQRQSRQRILKTGLQPQSCFSLRSRDIHRRH